MAGRQSRGGIERGDWTPGANVLDQIHHENIVTFVRYCGLGGESAVCEVT